MSQSNETSAPLGTTQKKGVLAWIIRTIMGGIVLVLPFAVMIGLVHYVYSLLNSYLVDPLLKLMLPEEMEDWYVAYWGPWASLLGVLVFLFFMGLLFRTRFRNLVDWSLGNVPGVRTLYSAVSDTAKALAGVPGLANVDTVVLVPFPHSDMRMAGYLMTKSKQPNGRSLVAVYVPLVLFPPSGYTVVLPEDQVVYTDWPTKDVWKMLLSGGLTLPSEIPFEPEEGSTRNQETSGEAAVKHDG